MRALAGTITYFSSEGASGHERFEMIPHASGRTLRALCRMDDIDVWRDVSILLDSNSRPINAHVRIVQAGVVRAAMAYTTIANSLKYYGMTATQADVDEHITLQAPLDYLGLHPLVGDALVTCLRGRDSPGVFRSVRGYTNSYSADGESGLLAYPIAIDVAFIDSGPVRVAAGDFFAHHYQLRWQSQWPVADLWVDGDDALFLKLTWELNRSRYELTELHPLA